MNIDLIKQMIESANSQKEKIKVNYNQEKVKTLKALKEECDKKLKEQDTISEYIHFCFYPTALKIFNNKFPERKTQDNGTITTDGIFITTDLHNKELITWEEINELY